MGRRLVAWTRVFLNQRLIGSKKVDRKMIGLE